MMRRWPLTSPPHTLKCRNEQCIGIELDGCGNDRASTGYRNWLSDAPLRDELARISRPASCAIDRRLIDLDHFEVIRTRDHVVRDASGLKAVNGMERDVAREASEAERYRSTQHVG